MEEDLVLSETTTFSDELLTCESCGKTFVFRVSEQRRMAQRDGEVTPPTECPACRQRDSDTGRWQGEVKWFDVQKGYGFIRKPDGEEIFFHHSNLAAGNPDDVTEGRKVEFDVQETPKGPEAVEVTLAP
jgi:CspA family cold shock protein